MTITDGSKIQSGPDHRHTVAAGKPVTGTAVRVRADHLVEVVWDQVMIGTRLRQPSNSLELSSELELRTN